MIPRELKNRPRHIYPPEEWRMVEKKFHSELLAQNESLFTVSNGYLGVRGCFEEGAPVWQSGIFLNGFYECWPIIYGEEAYGFPKLGQTIVNVADSKIINLYVDDEPFFISKANIINYERALDMRCGTLDREILWETPRGKRVLIKSKRLVSFEHKHLALISYEVTILNASAQVVISSKVGTGMRKQHDETDEEDPRLGKRFENRVLSPNLNYVKDNRILLCHTTKNSKLGIACGIDHMLDTSCSYTCTGKSSENYGKIVFSVDAKSSVPIKLTKYMAYYRSRENDTPEELCDRTERALNRSLDKGFNSYINSQKKYMDEFWERSDVQVKGDLVLQQAIRFNLFHILQASARAEGTGIPAKGLTSQGYEGHYFWDSEIYILPFLIYTAPQVAKNLIKFRYGYLDKARKRAKEVNQKGALFPWRTINGDEASGNYAAGTAQYHINADIIYALKKYVEVTGDKEFLYSIGVEMLVETSRFWMDIGFFSERRNGRFCINGVTGPDEYNTVVNNNTYTNLMARENLCYAVESLNMLKEENPDRFKAIAYEMGLKDFEINRWQEAADKIYLPYDEEKGIHLQDDSFLDKEVWDFENTPDEKYPLLLHYHPLVIYRYRVIKQADVLLAILLIGNKFSLDEKKRSFDFYDPLTVGDSSLSFSIQSVLASEVGYFEKALEYGRHALLMDIDDVAGNAKNGCHIASMGGTWMIFVYGVAGMRDYDGKLSFKPISPMNDRRISFTLTYQGRKIVVDIKKESVTYSLRSGKDIAIVHEDREIILSQGKPVKMQLKITR